MLANVVFHVYNLKPCEDEVKKSSLLTQKLKTRILLNSLERNCESMRDSNLISSVQFGLDT